MSEQLHQAHPTRIVAPDVLSFGTTSGAIAAAKEGGKHSVLLRIKSREGTR